jgi:hypothetical protein
MTAAENEETPMTVDNPEEGITHSLHPSSSSTSKPKKAVTIKDSMEAISDLIKELQDSDEQLSNSFSNNSIPPLPTSHKRQAL